MATVDWRTGQIIERANGRKYCYNTGSKDKRFLKTVLEAHKIILDCLRPSRLSSISPEEIKSLALTYAQTDKSSRKELIYRLSEDNFEKKEEVPVEIMIEEWLRQKKAVGISDKMLYSLIFIKNVISDFFRENGIKFVADLQKDTAYKFLEWRKSKTYNPLKKSITSASTVRHELQILKQMASVAYDCDWLKKDNIWSKVNIKNLAGVNVKIVAPLLLEEQKALLETLKLRNIVMHDAVLFLLLTGIRVGELDYLNIDSLQSNALHLNGNSVGNMKTTGKTASACRIIPVCETLRKLFERGNIFKARACNVKCNLRRDSFQKIHKGIHPHRLRHSFAVNKLLAQTPLQMVSYQLGHSDIGTTANLYGKFVPEHFKAGFEEAIKERKEWTDYLENNYFR